MSDLVSSRGLRLVFCCRQNSQRNKIGAIGFCTDGSVQYMKLHHLHGGESLILMQCLFVCRDDDQIKPGTQVGLVECLL